MDLEKNQIESIASNSFEDLRQLKYLELAGNQIKTIDPQWFVSLSNLEKLLLNENKIEHLDENVFDNLPNLVTILLDNNQLKTIPLNLLKNKNKLKWFGLSFNQIQIANYVTFDQLETIVDLAGNVCANKRYVKYEVDGNPEIGDKSDLKKDLDANCTQTLELSPQN